MYDVYKIRKDFPIFDVLINGKPVAYLDTTASAQKPQAVFDAMRRVYYEFYANPHRGTYYFADAITKVYEKEMRVKHEKLSLLVMPPNRLIWWRQRGDCKICTAAMKF